MKIHYWLLVRLSMVWTCPMLPATSPSMMRHRVAVISLATFCLLHSSVLGTPLPPGVTPCSAPQFEKIEETLPACGPAADGVVRVSGKIRVTNRAPTEIKQVLLLRKAKVLGNPTVAAAPGNTGATEISFDYAEPAVTYQAPLDLVIVPKCGPVVSISIDRSGRCS